MNELLSEIVHLASAAVVLDDEEVKRQALADIADALASVLPVNHKRAEPIIPGCPSLMPGAVIVHDEPQPIIAKRNYKRQRISYPDGLTTTIEKEGRKLVGVIKGTGESLIDDGYPYKYYADVYENGDLLFSIDSCPRGKAFLEHVLRGALHGAAIQLTHKMHNRQNRKARRAAALD